MTAQQRLFITVELEIAGSGPGAIRRWNTRIQARTNPAEPMNVDDSSYFPDIHNAVHYAWKVLNRLQYEFQGPHLDEARLLAGAEDTTNGETITATYGCSATPASPIGNYSIIPNPAGATLGNYSVIMCERGIRTFEEYCRNTLPLSVVPELNERTRAPP